MAELRKSAEDYLETILILKNKNGVVHSIDVAHHLSYSKPSVSRAVANLKRDGYIDMAPGGELTLTDTGLSTAKNVYERHTILSSFLAKLGVSAEAAADDACLVEHVISDESFACIKAFVEGHGGEDGGSAEKDDKKKKKKKKKS